MTETQALQLHSDKVHPAGCTCGRHMDLESYPMNLDTEMHTLPTYNRKEKSLGLLCENFLSLYGAEEEEECISLDEAATRLGVERRRIYDIVNILESVEVLVRKAKNCYMWYGFTRLPQALKTMKEAALRDYGLQGFRGLPGNILEDNYNGTNQENEEATFGTQESVNKPSKTSHSPEDQVRTYEESYNFYRPKSKADCRREKSLGLLSQKFVQLFLVSQTQVVSLDEAAKVLFGACSDPSKLKTKVRRLYDIANVLTSLQLIEKTHGTENRKPAFKWLGVRDNMKDGVPFRKRQFGACRSASADPPAATNPMKRPAIRRAVSIEHPGKRYNFKSLQPKCASFGSNPPPVFPRASADGGAVLDASVPSGMSKAFPFSVHFGPTAGWMDWSRNAADCKCLAECKAKGAECPANDAPWASGHSCSMLPNAHGECTCSVKAAHDSMEFLSRYPMVNMFCPCHLMQELGAGSACVADSLPEAVFNSQGVCPVHAAHAGIAAAMQYQNETLNHMFAHYMDAWKSWYLQGQPTVDPAHQASCDSMCNK